MASDSQQSCGEENLSCSPKEDYDPLKDDMFEGKDLETHMAVNNLASRFGSHEHRSQEYSSDSAHDPESPSSSLDAESGGFEKYKYGVTPPANPRERKLSKERVKGSRHKVSRAEMREAFRMQKQERSRTVRRGLARENVSADAVLNSIQMETEDKDIFPEEEQNDTSTSAKKRTSSKNFTTSRAYDRDLKFSASDLMALDGPTSLPPLVMQPMVDIPNRFLSLKPVSASLEHDVGNSTENKPAHTKLHRPSITTVECPQDRLNFYKTFSMLVNLGNSTKKHEKEKEKDSLLTKPGFFPFARQMSSEQIEFWQNQLNDLIWLELQAWHWGRTMDQQDMFLLKARELVPQILDEILNFKLTVPSNSLVADVVEGVEDNTGEHFSSLDGIIDNETQASIQQPNLHKCVSNLKNALAQVDELLLKLEKVENLYPSSRTMCKDNPTYGTEDVQGRISTLCMWRNITMDLGHKVQIMARVLCVNQIEGIEWPWMDCVATTHENPEDIRNSENMITPDIQVQEAEDEDEEEGDSYYSDDEGERSTDSRGQNLQPQIFKRTLSTSSKNVRFNLSDSSPSTPDNEVPNPLLTAANETSTPGKDEQQSSVARTFSNMSIEDLTRTSIYRYFVDRTLKRMGLNKAQQRLRSILQSTLRRAKCALERPRKESAINCHHPDKESPSDVYPTSPLYSGSEKMPHWARANDIRPAEGELSWPQRFEEMGLPSFRPLYMFLVRIPLDVLHECLRLRLEQRPEADPSLLSVRQLIRECKEVLLAGTFIKQYWSYMVSAVGDQDDPDRQEAAIEDFEEDLKEMLAVYFNYLQTWMTGLQEMQELDMSKRLKNFLEDEWKFTKRVSPHIRGGEANSANRFCLMASSLMRSISDFLDNGVDECFSLLYDSMPLESEFESSQEEMVFRGSQEQWEEGGEAETGSGGRAKEEDQGAELSSPLRRNTSKSMEVRQAIIQCCRRFKEHFHEARERASKALGFAKMLRKDLEVAADFNVSVTASELLKTLKDTGHVRIQTPHRSGRMMFIPQRIQGDSKHILHLLNITCGREDLMSVSPHAHEGYLLLVRCEGCSDQNPVCPLWEGPTLRVAPTAETTIALSHIEVEGLLFVVLHSSQLITLRKDFQRLMGDVVSLANEQTSCHQAIAESLAELKTAAMDLREKVAYSITQVDEKLTLDDMAEMDEAEKQNIQKLYRETLYQCYNFGFEYHKEVTRLVSGDSRRNLTQALVAFAKQWMKFVSEKCERGRGLRPRWSNQGLDFLIVACEPRVLATLTDQEFAELKSCINSCISHVIGDKASPGSTYTGGHRMSSPDVMSQRAAILRNLSCPETPTRQYHRNLSARSVQSEPGTAGTLNETGLKKSSSESSSSRASAESEPALPLGEEGPMVFEVDGTFKEKRASKENPSSPEADSIELLNQPSPPRLKNIASCIASLEQHRTNELYKRRAIGRVTNQKVEVDFHINIRRVNFKWQRGNKIGEGQFGKVYTAVNMETAQLMAMKELRFAPNDYQTIKEIADEIKIFEEISHPSLVQYYGVEVHRDEMLIFMEYCAEGTIEEVAKQGLPEPMVRKYTSELLVAVSVLHDHGIVHRDIKGANIFLTSHGPVKLGDFGCSVKLKNPNTMPGEVANTVGTAAYMAPEVITGSEHGGRASDIWSLGCVVIEMITGKRPWHDLQHNYQIMFKVGMGATPFVPDTLSPEGQNFLLHCLEHDPKQRWTASQLQDHPFVKVYTEDEADNFGPDSFSPPSHFHHDHADNTTSV